VNRLQRRATACTGRQCHSDDFIINNSALQGSFRSVNCRNWFSFCRAMLCISAAYSVERCPTACPSVCLSRSCILLKRINIFKFVSLSGSHIILVLLHQTLWKHTDGDPLLTRTSNAGGVGKNRDSRRISGFTACFQLIVRRPSVIHT